MCRFERSAKKRTIVLEEDHDERGDDETSSKNVIFNFRLCGDPLKFGSNHCLCVVRAHELGGSVARAVCCK